MKYNLVLELMLENFPEAYVKYLKKEFPQHFTPLLIAKDLTYSEARKIYEELKEKYTSEYSSYNFYIANDFDCYNYREGFLLSDEKIASILNN